ncbi:hypothetical protein [Thalassospira mesophila]|uniref:Uncharacterized protein n=1 Tax=Thalassospira mesophila TaxID=1293891 RepID=A0A1Y2KVE9_9PROT|nr:hypothetical protein [Thalassospira mesophila]OSQ35249.1 hypothetical protein TMES_21595 [Thalassospira mesophila]
MPADDYAGFLPPVFANRPDGEDITLRTFIVGDPLPDHQMAGIPAPLQMFLDLVAPAMERAGADGFAHLWLDHHPHEQPGWRLSLAHIGTVADLNAAVAKPLARLAQAMSVTEFETANWEETRPLWRKRAQPVRLVYWGRLGRHVRAVIGHGDAPSFYLPAGAGVRSDQAVASLPLLDDMLGARSVLAADGLGFENALQIGIALGRAHLIESWIEAGGDEKEPYFRPMQIWHQAWLTHAVMDLAIASLAMSGQPPMPALDYAGDATPQSRKAALDDLSAWLTALFFSEANPAHRNAFIAGVQNAVWLDPDLQQYVQPQQRDEIIQGLLPYCRWFLAMALYNHLGNLADDRATADQISLFDLLVASLPELASLNSLSTQRDIEQHIIRIDAARAAAAFDALVIPFCDLLMPGLSLAASRHQAG